MKRMLAVAILAAMAVGCSTVQTRVVRPVRQNIIRPITQGRPVVITEPAAASGLVMGQYYGNYTVGETRGLGEARVIGLGNKNYEIQLNTAPSTAPKAVRVTVERRANWLMRKFMKDENVEASGMADGTRWVCRVAHDRLSARGSNGATFDLMKNVPHSPSEGFQPPAVAVVLLRYTPGQPTTLGDWTNPNWPLLPDGSVHVRGGDNKSRQRFRDYHMHVEFMTPYMPSGRGQERGNSGVYMQDWYEVQVLDSFGLAPKDNECGGIYSFSAPRVNACYPPLVWQTYDIDFRAMRFEDDGKTMKEPATVSVVHNGVPIQQAVKMNRSTERSKPGGEPRVGPIRLQDHGNPVRYRNIWLVEK